jgi:hypothetical protein
MPSLTTRDSAKPKTIKRKRFSQQQQKIAGVYLSSLTLHKTLQKKFPQGAPAVNQKLIGLHR